MIRLPANYEAVYGSAIAELKRHLATREASACRVAIRALIESVIVHGGDSRRGKHRRRELHGDLFQMLEFAEAAASSEAQKRQKPQHENVGALSRTSLVAGAEFHRCRTRFKLPDHVRVK